MLIGLDFDNTIVCYDRLFHRLAVERGLIPASLPSTKQAVRNFLRDTGRESDWTELQGVAYGPRITDAEPFPGIKRFLARCRESAVDVIIVSHKTRRPYRGENYDLHAAAHKFLEAHGFYRTWETGLSADRVNLETTLRGKLNRIHQLCCRAFVDDLPEVLMEPAFPVGVQKVLFDPSRVLSDHEDFCRVVSWDDCADVLLRPAELFA